MIRAAMLALLLSPLAAPAWAQGACRDGYRWTGGEGMARYASCAEGTDLLTLTCTRGTPLEGRVAFDTSTLADGGATTGQINADGQFATLRLTPAEEGGALSFEMPEPVIAAMARGSVARISAAGQSAMLHLSGSSAAISAMRASCRAPAPPDPGPGPDEAEAEPEDESEDEPPTALSGDLAAGTAPAEAVVAAFRTARDGRGPEETAEDAPAPRRCDALAAASFARIEASEMREVCRAAMEAAPDTPRHAFDAARAELAAGNPEAAMPLLRQAARAGQPAAMNALALAILSGRTAPEEGEDTAALLSGAAEAGYPPALANLAIGNANAGPLSDYAAARDLAADAARAGDPVAATLLGTMARDGAGMPPDRDLALRWLRVGAARGDADALAALAALAPEAETYRAAAIAAGHRAAIVSAGLSGDAADAEEMTGAVAAEPLRRGWDDGLRYLGDGGDGDGAIFRAIRDAGTAADPVRDALRARLNCDGGALYLVSGDRVACTAP